jgi:hypothetical protein
VKFGNLPPATSAASVQFPYPNKRPHKSVRPHPSITVSSKNFLSFWKKMAPSWTHLIRFVAEETGQIHLGQIDANEYPDLGIASVEGKTIRAKEVTGSIFDGVVTDKVLTVKQVRP